MTTPSVENPKMAAGRPLLIRGLTALAVIVFLGSLVLIYCNWANTILPPSQIELVGKPEQEGTVASLSGPSLPSPVMIVLKKSNDYRAVFFVHPGNYTLKAVVPGNPKVHEQTVAISDGDAWRLKLSQLLSAATTEPAS